MSGVPYLNLMILLSRFVFIGFALVFICVAFSFMKPFISYTLGKNKQKNTLLYLCIVFFHIAGTAILLGKASDAQSIAQILTNSVLMLGIMTIARWVIMLFKHQEQLVLWHLIFFLLDVGYIMLQRLDAVEATKQVRWIGLGVTIALTLPYAFKWLIHYKYKYLYLGITLGLIMLPFFFGERIYGAMNWVQIGPIGFQPSEFGKITFVMYVASFFYDFHKKKHPFKELIKVGSATGIILLMLVAQKDLGAGLLYFILFLIMLYLGTSQILLPMLGVLAGSVAAGLGYVLFGHVRVRVAAWLNPWADISGSGYQVVQGLFAMGTWGWFGSGLTRGIPEQIPIVTTDYIFPALCEEFGTLFGIVVVLCYLGIVLQGLKIALVHHDLFVKMMITGLISIIGVQAFIILAGVLKLMPLTGITLPFVSYGGSSILTSLGVIGLLGCLLASTLKQARKEGGSSGKS